MGYPYDKRYIDQIRERKEECKDIEKAYYVLRSKYIKDHQGYSDPIDLSISESFTILGEAFELASDTVDNITDVHHFMWDILGELLTPVEKDDTICGNLVIADYNSLAELNEEWEDYEEPKEFYVVENRGTVGSRFRTGDEYEKTFKAIGNYFETKEEAEKALEKLKAMANLRKRGLKFNGWDSADRGLVGEFEIYCDAVNLDGIEQELELVFGREEL